MRLFGMGAPARCNDIFGGGAAVGGIAQAAGSVAAAGIQASAANHASDLTSQASANSLQFNKDVYNKQQENAQPWLDTGKTALSQLASGTAAGGQFTQTYGKSFDGGPAFNGGPAFAAPTTVDEQNDPGYKFRLQQGQQAIERSAAARGGVMGGGVLKDLTDYSQGQASQEYGNVYNRALQGYQANFGNNLQTYQTNFGNNLAGFNTNYNQFNTDQSNQFNRLATLSGIGQTANGQLNTAGTAAANNFSNTSMTGANNAGNYLTQGANAIGSGIVGAGNAIGQYTALQAIAKTPVGGYAPSGGNGYDPAYDPNSSSYYETGD